MVFINGMVVPDPRHPRVRQHQDRANGVTLGTG
jgi:hypothetical protein